MSSESTTQYQFKTNIHCGSCVRGVQGFLNELPLIKSWEVDTENPDKILTVHTDDDSPQAIIEAVEEAGFDATLISGQ